MSLLRRIAVVALAALVTLVIAFYGDFETPERAKVITMVALALLAPPIEHLGFPTRTAWPKEARPNFLANEREISVVCCN